MRILRRLSVIAALAAAAALALAAPAFAAGSEQQATTIENHWRNQMPEVPYAALLPVVGLGAVVLLRRRRARVD